MMNIIPQLIVFDIAGTTVRDNGGVADAFTKAAKQFGVQVPLAEVNKVMGFRKKEAIRLLLDKFYEDTDAGKEALVEKIHDSFTQHMVRFYEEDKELTALPHAEEMFTWLRGKGVKIALNTGFTRVITDTILKRLQWLENGLVDMVVCSDEVPQGRPQPFMIRRIMEAFDITDAAAVVKVGDTEVDVQEGQHAGCGLVVAVTTGAYTRSELEPYRPDHIIDSLSQLQPLIP